MSPDTTQARDLAKTIRRAMQLGQIEVYGERSRFYHRGLYSNSTSLWSHSPAAALQQPGKYLITTRPDQSISLAVLRKGDFDHLFNPLMSGQQSVNQALEALCAQLDELEQERFPVDGIASYQLEPNGHYKYIILFRPLKTQQLLDIEPVSI